MGQGKQGQRDFHGKEQMALALAVKTKILNHWFVEPHHRSFCQEYSGLKSK